MPLEATTKAIASGSLADYTRCDLIVLQLREWDATGIIGELSRALGQADCVTDVLSFYQAALNQELLSDSAGQSSVAVAHARLNGVKGLQFAFGRTAMPVLWNSKDSRPVQLIFLLAVPATESARYLQLLSSLARLGQNPEAVAKLLAAQDGPALLKIFEKTPL